MRSFVLITLTVISISLVLQPNRARCACEDRFKGVIVSADQVDEQNLAQWKTQGDRVALVLTDEEFHQKELAAAEKIVAADLELDYFIEIAHCPKLADEHPEWMASLQGHPEWRQQFPDAPKPKEDQVIKCYPWVPILYKESADAHLERVTELLRDKPAPHRLWLNDLQAAPSACGCGHPLCRWTADYGPIKTATPLDHSAAASFVKRVSEIVPTAEVIPIFVGECEAEDEETICCEVACFEGKCWTEFTKQLDSVAVESEHIAVACFYKLFDRDLDRYGDEAGWIAFTLNSFSEMPKLRKGTGVATERLVAIVQGWDVTTSEVDAQVSQAEKAKTAGCLIALTPIAQSWEPKLVHCPK